jgi:eukaryotic translation initiation factor 2-alpha kinase 3
MSFFRSPFSQDGTTTTTEETTSEEDAGVGHESAASHTINPIQKIKTVSSTSADDDPIALAESRRLNSDAEQLSNLMMHALLEEKAQSQALDFLNTHRPLPEGRRYRVDDREVQELARSKYQFIIEQFSGRGITSKAYSTDELKTTRDQYRQGIEALGKAHNEEEKLLTKGAKLNVLPAVLNRAPSALRQKFSSTKPSQPNLSAENVMKFAGSMAALPLVLQPFVGQHPILVSRFQRDFDYKGMLGKGGYGRVVKVENKLDGFEYAVKLIPLSTSRVNKIRLNGQPELEEVLKELRILARLEYAHVVRYYGGWLEFSVEPDALQLSNPPVIPLNRRLISSAMLNKKTHHLREHSATETDVISPHVSNVQPDDSVEILFEASTDAIDYDHSASREIVLDAPRRRTSAATMSSTRSHKSTTLGSIGDDEEVESIPRDDAVIGKRRQPFITANPAVSSFMDDR